MTSTMKKINAVSETKFAFCNLSSQKSMLCKENYELGVRGQDVGTHRGILDKWIWF